MTVTPLAEAQKIFAQAASPEDLWIIPGAGHVDLHARAGRKYEEKVLAFLDA
jgi:fermentation-respiration switch protein FrsA (DUF1100 family)